MLDRFLTRIVYKVIKGIIVRLRDLGTSLIEKVFSFLRILYGII